VGLAFPPFTALWHVRNPGCLACSTRNRSAASTADGFWQFGLIESVWEFLPTAIFALSPCLVLWSGAFGGLRRYPGERIRKKTEASHHGARHWRLIPIRLRLWAIGSPPLLFLAPPFFCTTASPWFFFGRQTAGLGPSRVQRHWTAFGNWTPAPSNARCTIPSASNRRGLVG